MPLELHHGDARPLERSDQPLGGLQQLRGDVLTNPQTASTPGEGDFVQATVLECVEDVAVFGENLDAHALSLKHGLEDYRGCLQKGREALAKLLFTGGVLDDMGLALTGAARDGLGGFQYHGVLRAH